MPELKEHGFDLKLLHIGSWGGDLGRPKEECIGELFVRDISYYPKKNLHEILEFEQPDAVLFLSNDVFAHRAFNRYCGTKGIPTLLLYHGLVEIQSTHGERMYNTNLYNQVFHVSSRILKALTKVWPLYAHALHITKAGGNDWGRFFSDIINLAMGKYIPIAAPDSRASACAVYTKADVDHALKKYGYARGDVHVVGNPDLSKFNLKSEMLGCADAEKRETNKEIVYIDTGLIYAGLVFANADDYLLHLTTLAKTLVSQGLSLAIKLHPDHDRTNFPKQIEKLGIRVINNEEFVPSLLRCRGAMVEPSTAALIPALLGLPLMMVAFGKLKEQKYGKVLMDYPRSSLLTDVSSAISEIKKIESNPAKELNTWITNNAGPLPADEMPNRVAQVIAQLVER